VVIALVLGVLGFFMEENGIPVAPAILGLVLARCWRTTSSPRSSRRMGSLLAFFERPIAGTLGIATLALWLVPLGVLLARRFRQAPTQ
jgi:putative tricarboxylic transport membrane protein